MIRRAIGLLFLLGAIPAAAHAQTTYINPDAWWRSHDANLPAAWWRSLDDIYQSDAWWRSHDANLPASG